MQDLINEILRTNKTKSDMAYLICAMDFYNTFGMYYNFCKKEEIKNELIKLLNTDKIFKLKNISSMKNLIETFEEKQKEEIIELKAYEAEIYTLCPITCQTGWDIKMIRTLAKSKKDAKENFKKYPLFDCIILWNQVSGVPDDLDLKTINKNNLYYFASSNN